MSEMIDPGERVRDCKVVVSGAPFVGKQGFTYMPAISAETVGATGIHMQLLTIPPGGRAKAHKHEGHETAIYAVSGVSGMHYGQRLEKHMTIRPGEFLYIPADMPHLPYNASETEPAVAIIARTDPNEQESVVLLPELEALVPR
jgi:uncharacterized RmlC-like cupin family protein